MVKNLPASAADSGDMGLIPRWDRYSEKGNGNPFKCFCLENSVNRGAWWTAVCGVARNWMRLNTHRHINSAKQSSLFYSLSMA